jgi:hypothetical protein
MGTNEGLRSRFDMERMDERDSRTCRRANDARRPQRCIGIRRDPLHDSEQSLPPLISHHPHS